MSCTILILGPPTGPSECVKGAQCHETRKEQQHCWNRFCPARLSSDALEDLLRCKVDEDLHLEYKHGDVLKQPGQAPSQMIREYVSGFANGAGGVLLVGVDEGKWQVTGCTGPQGDLIRWASSCVSPISGFLSPPPRYETVDCGGREVLAVATARSPVLAPCYEAPQRPVYYLRMDDKTLPANEYLVADLILGRRQHAYLSTDGVEAHTAGLRMDGDGTYDWRFRLEFVIANQAFASAEKVIVGIVARHHGDHAGMLAMSEHLRQHVDVHTQKARFVSDPAIGLQLGGIAGLKAFTLEKAVSKGILSAPVSSRFGSYTPYVWNAGVYVIAEHTPPLWYQLTIEVDSQLLQYLQSTDALYSTGSQLRVERVPAGRPVVGWIGPSI